MKTEHSADKVQSDYDRCICFIGDNINPKCPVHNLAADKSQEWTHEKLQGLLQISNEDRYVADHAFENALDEINASITAEREKRELNLNDILSSAVNMIACGINHTFSPDDEEYVKSQVDWALRQSVLSANKKIQQLHEQLEDVTSAAQMAVGAEKHKLAAAQAAMKLAIEQPYHVDAYRILEDTLKGDTAALDAAIAAAQKPLVDALTLIRDRCEKSRPSIFVMRDIIEWCKDALAKVKEGKA